MPVHFEVLGAPQTEACRCGCGQIHRRMNGMATHSPEGGRVLFLCLLARHDDERHVWLAIGHGPEGPGERDCFSSVEVWPVEGGLGSRMTEGGESPFRQHPLFGAKGAARFFARDEVVAHPERKQWLFDWVDEFMEYEPLKNFIFGDE